MKKIAESFIHLYQVFISPILKQMLGVNKFCISSPTCSEYTRQAILKYGFFRGSLLGAKRLASCH